MVELGKPEVVGVEMANLLMSSGPILDGRTSRLKYFPVTLSNLFGVKTSVL